MDDSQEAKENYFNKAQWTTVKELRKNTSTNTMDDSQGAK